MKTKTYHTVGTVLKSYRKILERDKIDTSTAKLLTSHFPVLIQALQ